MQQQVGIQRPVTHDGCSQLGLAISDKKVIPRKTEETQQLVYSGGIPAVPRKRKLSEFRSKPFRREEKVSEKMKANSRSSVPKHFADEKYALNFCKPNFFMLFRSVPSFGTDSSGKPRNVHFLPRNNGNRSESFPRNFF
jgi:hypothetical protein